MEVSPFHPEHLPQAAALFVRNFKLLRQEISLLPTGMENEEAVLLRLMQLCAAQRGFAAFEQDRLVGYLGWFVLDGFRETKRRAAYSPEWGHAAEPGIKPAVYRALYRAAAGEMASSGCQAHAITLLARDPIAEQVWFWNGFGLIVIDAVRPIEPLETTPAVGYTIRTASTDDAQILAMLEIEHWQHYTEPPVLMAPQPPSDAAEFAALISDPKNAVWLALDSDRPVGYIRFESSRGRAAGVLVDNSTVSITGAFVRPEYRGRRITPALLHAGLQDFAKRGYCRCAVDFESFNPEAAAFWTRYFEPVCLSLMRVPERELDVEERG